MNSVPIKKALEFGGWYECRAIYFQESFDFRLRVIGFKRTSIAEIAPRFNGPCRAEGVLWLLSLEIVNLTKVPIEGWKIRKCIKLIDTGGYEFPAVGEPPELTSSGPLHRFSGWGDNPPLSPKLKATGSLAFDLPDEENAYSLALHQGSIKEA